MHFIFAIFVMDIVCANPAASPALSIVTTSLGSKVPYMADYSGKVSVSVGSVLTQQEAAVAAQSSPIRPRSSMGTRSVQNDPTPSPPLPATAPAHYDQRTFLSWSPPPVNAADDFSRVDVHVFGERISSSALNYLQPNLNRPTVAKLRVILGSDYNDAWMSPENPGNRSLTGYFPRTGHSLIDELNQLNYSLADGDRIHMMNPSEVSIVKKWLLQKSTCPIEYTWKDLGNRVWPKWIRHAVCKEKQACSWPSGMNCRPSGTKTLKLLRWVSHYKYFHLKT